MDEEQKNYITSETLRLLEKGKHLDPFSISSQLDISPLQTKKLIDYIIIKKRAEKISYRKLNWGKLLRGVFVESMLKYFLKFPQIWIYLNLVRNVEDFGLLFYFFGLFGEKGYYFEQFFQGTEFSLYSFASFFPLDALFKQCCIYKYTYLEVPDLNIFIGGLYDIGSRRKRRIFDLLLGKI